VGLEEDLLHHVLGIGGVAAETEGEAVEAGAVQIDELGDGFVRGRSG
jgi:hypothetical protein